MLLSRRLLALKTFIGKDTTRVQLTAVHLTPTTATATDSYRLARITMAEESMTAADYPTVGGRRPTTEAIEPVMVQGKRLMEALAKIPGSAGDRRRGILPILSRAAIMSRSEVDVEVATVSADLDSSVVTNIRTIQGSFPDLTRFFKELEDSDLEPASISFGSRHVTITIRHPHKPATFTGCNDAGDVMDCVLMPVRS